MTQSRVAMDIVETNQCYAGGSWSTDLKRGILLPEDTITGPEQA